MEGVKVYSCWLQCLRIKVHRFRAVSIRKHRTLWFTLKVSVAETPKIMSFVPLSRV